MQIATLQSQIATLQAQAKTDSLRYANLKTSATAAAAAATVPDSVLREKDQEIATLKDQITQLNAELDRIKRRLASPKP
jgi:chromosome segregation ATPase